MAATTPTATEAGSSRATRAIAEHLYRDHHHFLLGVAIRNSADRPDAEEALQEAFVFFLDHFEPAGGTPALPWVTLTLKRRCWAVYRRRRSAPDTPQTTLLDATATTHPSPQDVAERGEELAVRRGLILRLPPTERQALGLLGLGFSYNEIMELTGWSYSKVNRSIRDGRARLREEH